MYTCMYVHSTRKAKYMYMYMYDISIPHTSVWSSTDLSFRMSLGRGVFHSSVVVLLECILVSTPDCCNCNLSFEVYSCLRPLLSLCQYPLPLPLSQLRLSHLLSPPPLDPHLRPLSSSLSHCHAAISLHLPLLSALFTSDMTFSLRCGHKFVLSL